MAIGIHIPVHLRPALERCLESVPAMMADRTIWMIWMQLRGHVSRIHGLVASQAFSTRYMPDDHIIVIPIDARLLARPGNLKEPASVARMAFCMIGFPIFPQHPIHAILCIRELPLIAAIRRDQILAFLTIETAEMHKESLALVDRPVSVLAARLIADIASRTLVMAHIRDSGHGMRPVIRHPGKHRFLASLALHLNSHIHQGKNKIVPYPHFPHRIPKFGSSWQPPENLMEFPSLPSP
jgi:hypothetical protein